MTAPIGGSARAAAVIPTTAREKDEAKLKQSAQALEGLFVAQLFQAMRAGVPTDGLLDRGPGEDLFTSMLDQKVADVVAQQDAGPRDLSSSLFDALRERLGRPADTAR